MISRLGPLALLSVAILFSLPFVDISCQGKKVAVLNGYETAFGKELKLDLASPPMKSSREDSLVDRFFRPREESSDARLSLQIREKTWDGKPMVAAAFICAIAGGVLGLFMRSFGVLGGVAAVVLLLISQNQMQKEIQEAPLLVMNFGVGFWSSLAAAGAGALLCLMGRK